MNENEKEIISDEEMSENENLEVNVSEETTPQNELPVEDELTKANTEIEEWKNKYMRLFAEFDNYKKRTSKEISDVIKTAGKDIILSMIEVLDDAERAEKQMEKATDIQAVKDGVTLIINKLNTVLTSKGLKSFESTGEIFDVEKHEALTEIPAPTDDLKGKVIDQVQKGYYLNDKLIRYAKVVVGKNDD